MLQVISLEEVVKTEQEIRSPRETVKCQRVGFCGWKTPTLRMSKQETSKNETEKDLKK